MRSFIVGGNSQKIEAEENDANTQSAIVESEEKIKLHLSQEGQISSVKKTVEKSIFSTPYYHQTGDSLFSKNEGTKYLKN